jgi:hypothetical protein
LSKLAVLTLGLLQGVAEAESRRAADAAEAAYQAAFKTDTPADEVALDREYERALSIGQRAFREVAVGQLRSACQTSAYTSALAYTSCKAWPHCGLSGVVSGGIGKTLERLRCFIMWMVRIHPRCIMSAQSVGMTLLLLPQGLLHNLPCMTA